MRTIWTFHGPGELVFGRNAASQLGQIASRLHARRVLIVTDLALASGGVMDRVAQPLGQSGAAIDVFDGGQSDPPIHAVARAVQQARQFRPDVLLGLGGGSNMDLAKATATLLAHGGSCQDYAGEERIPGPIFPLILVPTTAGTGSEVTWAAVLNDTERGMKFGILSNYLRPKVAVVDPLLSASCPPSVTADSGIDALTQAIEAYTAVDNEMFPLPAGVSSVYQGRHPLGDILAERAMELIGQFLRRAVADGSDLEAREGMSLAATLAGLSFSNVGVAAVHAIEYALGPVAHIPHGRGCGLLLPFVMRFNRPARIKQMARIASLLGEHTDGLSQEEAADRAIAAVEELRADIGIPARLGQVGVRGDQLPAMAETAFAVKRILRVNPRELSQQDLLLILQSAL
jgi:alcohol dehydrogenase class IV